MHVVDSEGIRLQFTRGVGPAGAYLKGVDAERREAIRAIARRVVPEGPFAIEAVAWAARGVR